MKDLKEIREELKKSAASPGGISATEAQLIMAEGGEAASRVADNMVKNKALYAVKHGASRRLFATQAQAV